MALTKIPRGLLDTGIADSSDATAITIDSSENVGIGTVSPNDKLHIKIGTNLNWQFGYPNSSVTTLAALNDAESAYVEGRIDTSNLVLNSQSGGKVGIGTTSPTELLEVNSTGATTAIEVSAGAASTTTGQAKIVLRSLHSASGTTYSRSEIASLGVAGGDSDLIFRTTTDTNGPQERMRIKSTGLTQFFTGDGSSNIAEFHTNASSGSVTGYISFAPQGTHRAYIGTGSSLLSGAAVSDFIIRSEGDLIFNSNGNNERMRILSAGQVAINDTGTSGHQFKVTSSTVAARFQGGNGGYTAISWTGNAGTTIGSLTTYDGRLYIGSQNSGGTGSNGEIVVKPGTSSSTGGVGTTLGRTPDVSLEVGGPLKIVNNTGGGISQTHTNMSVANSGKLLINFASIGTMTVGDTIVFTYSAISWKSWFFKIRWSSTGGYMGELWAGGYNNSSDGYQVLNPRYYAAASGDGTSNTTVEGATLTVTRSGQANTMTLTLTGTHVHPLFEIEYSCGGGEGYPQASRASITVNS